MSIFLSHLRLLLRPLAQAVGIHNGSSVRGMARLSLLTSVAGYDNKHPNCLTSLPSQWVYGDDACFISRTNTSYVLGVADGVGGWRAYGVDPGRFSRAVMKNCERLVSSGRFRPNQPGLLIAQSYEDVLTSKEPILGSATLCVISLQRNEHRIYTATLGDSGYLVVRRGRIVERSVHQKHTFNTPFQLACPPPVQSRNFYQDRPTQAVQTSMLVEPGDVLVVGTDGLFDNLTETVILQEVGTVKLLDMNALESLHQCARRLVERARQAAFVPDSSSPFANEARRYGINVAGGISGDITVILGLVVIEDQFPTPGCDFQTQAPYIEKAQSHVGDQRTRSVFSRSAVRPLRIRSRSCSERYLHPSSV
ncbi:hypothetical protein T265_06839 [Opisthorchis viverrini]|uniref:Protein phosphatase n=1 Tax=Opisthorchis viverrini TaxID=6198 RepID=A0A074ZEN1_OPIVI|nr:hypothetical protein T265_06839 [Opisthorchis viverrini]KER25736.1 hypothetical protein T265_06839 [Opisthorchis viverrini]